MKLKSEVFNFSVQFTATRLHHVVVGWFADISENQVQDTVTKSCITKHIKTHLHHNFNRKVGYRFNLAWKTNTIHMK